MSERELPEVVTGVNVSTLLRRVPETATQLETGPKLPLPESVTPDTIEGLKALGTATVCNAIVELTGGTTGRADLEVYTGPEIRCLLPDLGPAVGYALTCEITTSDPDVSGIPWDDYYEALDKAEGPTIAVFKDISRRVGRGASFGDEMAANHRMLGVVGAIVDGTVRDLAGIHGEGLPVWARGVVAGHGVFNLVRVNRPVTVAELQISPGDLLVADTAGAVKIPVEIGAVEVVAKGREIGKREAEYRALVRRPGATLAEARAWKNSRGLF